jgi:excinuclease ABC subunit B
VAILDADKEGFLRDATSLMQIAGRAARNVEGLVLFYADKITDSMREVLDETERRRRIQREYNEKHGIEPRSIIKSVDQVLNTTSVADAEERYRRKRLGLQKRPELELRGVLDSMSRSDVMLMVAEMNAEMQKAAEQTDYEKAAYLRDEILMLQERIEQMTE